MLRVTTSFELVQLKLRMHTARLLKMPTQLRGLAIRLIMHHIVIVTPANAIATPEEAIALPERPYARPAFSFCNTSPPNCFTSHGICDF